MSENKNINQSEWLMQPGWISDIANISEDVAEGVALIKDVSGDIENINNSLAAQKDINETLINNDDALNTKVTILESNLQATNETVVTNTQHISELESNLPETVQTMIDGSISEYNTTIQSSFSDTNLAVSMVSDNITSLSSTVSDNKSNTDSQISDMSVNLSKLDMTVSDYIESNDSSMASVTSGVASNAIAINSLAMNNVSNTAALKSYADSAAKSAASSEVSSFAIKQTQRDNAQDADTQNLANEVSNIRLDVDEANDAAKNAVKSVNNIRPDSNGNVSIDTISTVSFADIDGEYYENESLKNVIDSLSDNTSGDLSELQSSVNKNTSDIANLDTRVSDNATSIETLSDNVNVFETTITQKVDKHTIDIGALNDSVIENQASTDQHINTVATSLSSQITSATADWGSSYTELKSDIADTNTSLSMYKSDQAITNTSMSNDIASNSSKIAALESMAGGGVSSSEAARIVASANAYTDTKISDVTSLIDTNTADIVSLAEMQSDSVNIINSLSDNSVSNSASIASLVSTTQTMSDAIYVNQASNVSAIGSLNTTVSSNSVAASESIKYESTQRETIDNSLASKIDAVSMSSVKSVNGEMPDEFGNVTVQGGSDNQPWYTLLNSNIPEIYLRAKPNQNIPMNIVTVNSNNTKAEHSVISTNPKYILKNIPGLWKMELLAPTITDNKVDIDAPNVITMDNVTFSKTISDIVSSIMADTSALLSINNDIKVNNNIFAFRHVLKAGFGSDTQLKDPDFNNVTETSATSFGCTSRIEFDLLNSNGDVIDMDNISLTKTLRFDNNLLNGSWVKSDVFYQYYDGDADETIRGVVNASSSIVSTLYLRVVGNSIVADLFTSLKMMPDFNYYSTIGDFTPIVQQLNVRTPVKY